MTLRYAVVGATGGIWRHVVAADVDGRELPPQDREPARSVATAPGFLRLSDEDEPRHPVLRIAARPASAQEYKFRWEGP